MIGKVSMMKCLILVATLTAGQGTLAAGPVVSVPCMALLKSQTIETINERTVAINRLDRQKDYEAVDHPGVPLKEAFSGEPGIIFGIDTANSRQPYLIIGDTIFLVTKKRRETHFTTVYNPALKVAIPQAYFVTVYGLGAQPATAVRPGYFIRLSGISETRLNHIKSRILAAVNLGSENRSWDGMISNLKVAFTDASGIDFDCKDSNCDYIGDLLRKSLEHGFRDSEGGVIETQFYLVDYPRFAQALTNENRRMVASKLGLHLAGASLGVTGIGTVYILYNAIAMQMGWPQLPMP